MKANAIAGTLALILVAPAMAAGDEAGTQLGSVLKRAKQASDLHMSDADEQKLGEAVSEAIRTKYGVVQDPAIHKYVTLVGGALAVSSTRPSLNWRFVVLDTDGVNALAAPGGIVHVTRGLLSLMRSEAELADVLGHEIIHITEKHTLKAIQKGTATKIAAEESGAGGAVFGELVSKATNVVMAGFGRAEELESDQKGIALANKVGYDPSKLGAFLTSLSERNKASTEKQGLFASHPEMKERLEKLEKTIKDQKLAATVTLEARLATNVTYKPVPIAEIATVEAGSAGLAGGGSAKAGDESKKEGDKSGEKTEEPKKKKGFGLGRLMSPSSGGEKASGETTGSAAARGVDKERTAKGGDNPKIVAVNVTLNDINAFKKEGKLN